MAEWPIDPKLFKVYVVETRVWKGYDWIEVPGVGRLRVPPGRYMNITEGAFGFEARTMEIGEDPDFNYQEPSCSVSRHSQGLTRVAVELECYYSSRDRRTVELYYGDRLLYRFKGSIDRRVEITVVVEKTPLPIIAAAAMGPLAVALALYRRGGGGG